MPYSGRLDGGHTVPVSVSSTCLVRFDNNRDPAAASALGHPVEGRVYADRARYDRLRRAGASWTGHEAGPPDLPIVVGGAAFPKVREARSNADRGGHSNAV